MRASFIGRIIHGMWSSKQVGMETHKNRRDFLKTAGFIASSALLLPGINGCSNATVLKKMTENRTMTLTFKPYELQLKHPFKLASGSRTTTPVMLTEMAYDGVTGYGEASMPPYLVESHDSVGKFLSKVDLS